MLKIKGSFLAPLYYCLRYGVWLGVGGWAVSAYIGLAIVLPGLLYFVWVGDAMVLAIFGVLLQIFWWSGELYYLPHGETSL